MPGTTGSTPARSHGSPALSAAPAPPASRPRAPGRPLRVSVPSARRRHIHRSQPRGDGIFGGARESHDLFFGVGTPFPINRKENLRCVVLFSLGGGGSFWGPEATASALLLVPLRAPKRVPFSKRKPGKSRYFLEGSPAKP